jgi:N-acetylmuramic acid 6-phosphate etherase
MVRLGKSYGNLMIDVQGTNEKLRQRAVRLVGSIADLDAAGARAALIAADWDVKTAIIMSRVGLGVDAARQRLAAAGGHLGRALADT